MRNLIALIPAKGTSVGVPKKNLLSINGKTLVEYAITRCSDTGRFDNIYVNSEDSEILAIAAKSGADIYQRKENYSRVDTQMTDVVIDFLDCFNAENICLTQPTSPLCNSIHLDAALTLFFQGNFDTLVSVCKNPYIIDHNCKPMYATSNRQEKRPMFYRPNGAFYIFKTEYFKKHKNFIGGKAGCFVMSEWDSADIDTYDDYKNICKLMS